MKRRNQQNVFYGCCETPQKLLSLTLRLHKNTRHTPCSKYHAITRKRRPSCDQFTKMPLSLFHVSKRVSQKAPSAIAPLPKITGTCPWRRRSRSDRSSSEKIIPAHMTRASWLLSTKSALDVCFLFTLRTNLYHIFSKTGPRTGNVSKSHGTHRYALFLSSQTR